ncbi:MAG: hypothetical protein C0423_14265 [Methylibium sp.]|nr:hypothetical protein [Methylibium sp.]
MRLSHFQRRRSKSPAWPVWLALLLAGLIALGDVCAQSQMLPLPFELDGGPPEHLAQAQLAVTPMSRSQLDRWWETLKGLEGRGLPLSGMLQPPRDESAWTEVNLPDVRRRPPIGSSVPVGSQLAFEMRWYRMQYSTPDPSRLGRLAVYMARARALPVALLMRTDAGWVPVFDNTADAREQWVRPMMASLPGFASEQLMREGRLEMMLAVPVTRHEAFMVPSAWMGSRESVEPLYRARWLMQIMLPQGAGLLLAVVAVFALSVWLRNRQERAYLLCSALALFSMFRNLHYYADMPRDPVVFQWFWWLTHASMSWVLLTCFLLALVFVQRRYRAFERMLVGVVVFSTTLTMPLWPWPINTLLVQHLVNAMVALGGTGFVGFIAWRSGHRELRLISFGLAVAVMLGLHDLALLAGLAWHEQASVLPYATLVIAVCFLIAIRGRFVNALHQVEQANDQLARRLVEQGTQLQLQHEQLGEAERQQALLLERQRLMQDMHDGLGSSLLSAMVAVEQGRMQQDEVVGVLRECVDDLRLVIDSLEPVGHDLVSLLATMRYRLGKRLQTGGLTLEWDVQDLPTLDWLEPPDALHVLRLLQEALNNVLKHARATKVRISTRDLGERVEIRVEDDGQGFDLATSQKGRGLRSQLKRAQRLGGTVLVEARPGHGTRLSLRLPVQRTPPVAT